MTAVNDYRRFLAARPQAEREFRTIEIYHSQFPSNSNTRFVIGYQGDQSRFTLESGAPRNGGEMVDFFPIAGRVVEPSERDGIEQAISVSLGAVGSHVNSLIDSISGDGNLEQIECIYRKYYSGNLTEPVRIDYLSVSEINFDGYTSVGFVAEDSNLTTKRAGELYTLERFTGLVGV